MNEFQMRLGIKDVYIVCNYSVLNSSRIRDGMGYLPLTLQHIALGAAVKDAIHQTGGAVGSEIPLFEFLKKLYDRGIRYLDYDFKISPALDGYGWRAVVLRDIVAAWEKHRYSGSQKYFTFCGDICDYIDTFEAFCNCTVDKQYVEYLHPYGADVHTKNMCNNAIRGHSLRCEHRKYCLRSGL